MKIPASTKKIATQVINAIIQGAHTTDMIIRNQSLERHGFEVAEAIAYLQTKGIIEYHNRNMASEYGYFITEEGWSHI